MRVFRVDNPHTKALPFWEWCIAEVLKNAPDAIFLAEAFTRPHVMYSLAKGGFTQGYTYFTWRTTKAELQDYFEEITNPPVCDFFRPNVWPNTPDILHEQFQVADPPSAAPSFMQRVILAATLAANYGIYGPAYELCEGRPAKPAAGKTGSEEYLDSEKYQIRAWDRTDPISIAPAHHRAQPDPPRQPRPAAQRKPVLPHRPQRPDPGLLQVHGRLQQHHPHRRQPRPLQDQSATVTLNMDRLGLPWDATFESKISSPTPLHLARPPQLRPPPPPPNPPTSSASFVPNTNETPHISIVRCGVPTIATTHAAVHASNPQMPTTRRPQSS